MNTMADVTQPKSDQINADDLISGPMTVTITAVKIKAGEDQPIAMSLSGTQKVYRPSKSMARVFMAAWGADANVYVGRSLTLYRDPKVKWGGLEVGGIRISHMTDIDKDMVMMLTQTRAQRAPHKVKPLRVEQQTETPPQIDTEAAQAAARAAAGQGKAAFTAWWNGDGRTLRDAVKPIMPELTKLASDADGPPPDNDDDAPPM